MNSRKIKRLVIAGGGTAGWIAAALLSKALGSTVEIILVESDEIPTVGVGEATIPPLILLHQIMGVNEREFLAAVNGTFKLGISFEDWRQVNSKYIHSFGAAGKDCWACGFQHFWLKGSKQGIVEEYGNYCVEHYAARKGKFGLLPNAKLNYAYHFDAGLYAKFLRSKSEAMGVYRCEGKIQKVNLDPKSGAIQSLTLVSGEVIAGDFFIDCTGFKALLIGEALHTGFEDWSHWLPCDRAVAVQTESVSPPVPYTRSIARASGWQWRIPLQNRIGNGLVYCSHYLSDEDATNTLLQNVEGKTLNQPKIIRFRTGTRREHWNKNCLALGLSSGFLEPLESTSIHLIQKSIIRFMQMFPSDGVCQSDVDEFNRQTKIDVARIRDFIILHYHVTEREDSEFWRYCKNMSIPEELAQKIRLFRDSGKVFKAEDELFAVESWVQVMMGQGIVPESYHPIVDLMSDEELKLFLDTLKGQTQNKLDQMPSHQDFIYSYCKSSSL